jgi:hypothetical protein
MKAVSVGTILTAATKTTVYTVPTGYYAKLTPQATIKLLMLSGMTLVQLLRFMS